MAANFTCYILHVLFSALSVFNLKEDNLHDVQSWNDYYFGLEMGITIGCSIIILLGRHFNLDENKSYVKDQK